MRARAQNFRPRARACACAPLIFFRVRVRAHGSKFSGARARARARVFWNYARVLSLSFLEHWSRPRQLRRNTPKYYGRKQLRKTE